MNGAGVENELLQFCKNADSRLWQAITHFNYPSIEHIHCSWIDALGDQPMIARVKGCQRAQPALMAHLLARFELEPLNDYDFTLPEKRLLLLPRESLTELVDLCGATICRDYLSRVIAGDQLRSLKQAVGEGVYRIAFDKSRFLIATIPDYLLPRELDTAQFLQAPSQYIQRSGVKLLATALGHYPQQTIRRLMLKLPRDWEQTFDDAAYMAKVEDKRKLSIHLVKKLTREITVPCFHLFA